MENEENLMFGEPEPYAPPEASVQPEGFGEPEPLKLKESDLVQPVFMSKIRDYMVMRNGVDYAEMPSEDVLSDFLSTQRFIDAGNSITLTREAVFLNQLNDEKRSKVAEAYSLFENLDTNVISSEGVDMSGVKDYATAILADPVNLVGIGIGRLASQAGARVAAQSVRGAAKLARDRVVKEALDAGASTQVAAQAGKFTFRRTIEQAMRRQRLGKYAAVGAAEGAVIAGQNAGTQRVRQMADPSREFDYAELGLAGLLGAVGGVASVALERVGPNLNRTQVRQLLNKPLDDAALKEVKKSALENLTKYLRQTDWLAAAAKGRSLLGPDGTLDGSVFKEIVMGDKEKGIKGIIDFMSAAGVRINDKISYTIVDFLKDIPKEMKADFDKAFTEASKGMFGSVDDFTDKFAATIRRAGQDNQVMSQARIALEKRILANSAIEEALENSGAKSVSKLDEIVEGSYASYFQNVWKRLLVSNIDTTAINIAGSAIYVAGTTARDTLLATGNALRGNFTRSGQYIRAITDRAKFLADPLANDSSVNRIMFEEILKIDPSSFEPLRRTVNMGVAQPEDFEKLLKSYKFENLSKPAKMFLQGTEAGVSMAQRLTLVQTQDMFFKAFGLRDNLNRIARLKYGRSLDDIINAGEFRRLFTSDDFGEATHRTLQMTFSADYTARNKLYNHTNDGLATIARTVESLSNTPGIGFIFPFGKFVNNVVATSYQYFPLVPSIVEAARWTTGRMVGRQTKFNSDAFTNGLVGIGAVYTAYEIAKGKRDSGREDPWNVLRTPTGDRVDVTNTYPLSAMLIFGEVTYRLLNDEPVDEALMKELGRQVALGQAAEDMAVLDIAESLTMFLVQTPEEFIGTRSGMTGAIYEELGQVFGSVISGLTRPVATIDDIVGLATGNLDVLDRKLTEPGTGLERGAEAMQKEALRYTQRIFDAFSAKSEDDVDRALGLRFDAASSRTATEANPFSQALTFGAMQGARTYSQKMLESAQMAPWMANFRSKHPHFNRLANEYISPLLELYAKQELTQNDLMKLTPSERRVRVKSILRAVQKEAQDRIENGVQPGHMEYALERRIMSLQESRSTVDAYDTAIRQLGYTNVDPRLMTLKEKVDLIEKIESIQNLNRY